MAHTSDPEATFRDVAERAPMALALLRGPPHVVQCANAAFFELTGLDPSAPLRRPIAELLGAREGTAVSALLDGVYATHEARSAAELEQEHPGRGRIYCTWTAWPAGGAEPGAELLCLQGREVTAEVLANRQHAEIAGQRLEINERLVVSSLHDQELAEEREDLLARVQAANQAKSQFLSTMSHELRTPLQGTIGFADLLEREVLGPMTARQQEALARVKATAWHLLGIIDEILTFSRTEAGREEVHRSEVDVAEVARSVEAILAGEAQRRGLALRLSGVDERHVATTDGGKLRQILTNLVANALKYTETGAVEVELDAGEEWIEIRVRDTGPGIAADRLEDIFEPFVQLDGSATRVRGGTGLGLAITRRLARLLGGDVGVESTPGAGSTFVLRLPRRAAGRDAEDARPAG